MIRLISTTMATIALAAPLAAQSLEERAIAVVTQAQLAASAGDAEERRDRLVAAAWEARRIVEDAPESETARRVTGEGFEVLGAEPIRYDSLVSDMIEACITEPNALCLTDSFYVISAHLAALRLETRTAAGLSNEILSPPSFEFRGTAAVAYAELGHPDRVRATFTHHVSHDGRVSLVERARAAPDFAYALARIGDVEAARSILPDIRQAAIKDERWGNDVRFANSVENSERTLGMLAAGLMAIGDREGFEGLAGDTERVNDLFRALNRAHAWSLSPALRDAMTRHFETCLSVGRYPGSNCASDLAEVHARVGDLDAVRHVTLALEQAGTDRPIRPDPLYWEFLQQGHIDEARKWYSANLSEQIWAMASLGAILDPQLLREAEEMALAETDSAARNRHLRSIAGGLAAAGQMDEAARVVAMIDDLALRQETLDSFSYHRAYGALQQGNYADAFSALPKLDLSRLFLDGRHMLQHAVRNEVQ